MPSTVVTFPAGSIRGRSAVVRAEPLPDGRLAVVTTSTPFHPVDHAWPDQPADIGWLAGLPVIDCLTGTVDADGRLLAGADVDARRGDQDVDWVVVHVLPADAPAQAAADLVGHEVDLEVDDEARSALSAGHTACHLAALALNAEVAERGWWRKDPGRDDALGHPDLDQLAITDSRIRPYGAYDAYRFGRSLRKKGFEAAAFLADLPAVQDAVTVRLAAWVATGAAVRIEPGEDDTLAARRRWHCELPDGVAEVPCGGTHVRDLARLGRIEVAYAAEPDASGFSVSTTVHPAARPAAVATT